MVVPLCSKSDLSTFLRHRGKSTLDLSSKRCLVLGSTGYTGIDAVEWDAEDLPNIVDYDVVVVDVRSLHEEMLATIPSQRFRDFRTDLTRLLDSEGCIVVVSDFHKTYSPDRSLGIIVDNYDWCPITIGISKDSGKSLAVTDQRFAGYTKHLEQWPYYFFVPRSCLTSELTTFYGSPSNTRYKISLSSFVENRYKKTIAGAMRIEVKQERTKSSGYETYREYPNAPDFVTGEIVLLPLIEKFDHKDAVRLVLEEVVGVSLTYVPPSWVESVAIPGVSEVEAAVGEKEAQIPIPAQRDRGASGQAGVSQFGEKVTLLVGSRVGRMCIPRKPATHSI